MAYYLRHFFDPGFDHMHLKPRQRENGTVDHLDLGYVQNVVREQVVAQWEEVSEEEAERLPSRWVAEAPRNVAGDNCAMNPADPAQVVALKNGYVYYLDGLIAVKGLLNVRRNVDYHTGNVAFVGDVVLHGSVRTGFAVRANNVRAKDIIEGAEIKAMESVLCETGIKGAGRALVEAGLSLKAAFCENATLKARQNVVVEGACLHSHIYAGHKFATRGRLTGGAVYCYEYAFIGGQLGGGIGAQTQVMAGYDPMRLYEDQRFNALILETRENMAELRSRLGASPDADREIQDDLKRAERRLGLLYERKSRLWERISATEILDTSRIMVQGKVHPGVEISIGPAWYKVDDYLEDVKFSLKDREIIITSPAVQK
jgi:uncharacterized protein (DUF342 family)